MFRLQVLCKKKWIWGLNEYPTLEEANKRVEELAAAKVKARVRRNEELFN